MSEPSDSKKNRFLGIAKIAFRVAVIGLVSWGIWRSVVKSLDQLEQQQFSLSGIHFGWLVAAGVFYLLGLVPSWLFWHNTLRAMGQQPTLWESFRAYYLSHLGKYVPGKAMVVILRANAIRSRRVDTTVAATSTFVETLTLMAVGSLVAAVLIAVMFRQETWLLMLAIGLLVCAGVPTLPPIFRRVVLMLQVRRANPEIETALKGLNYRLMLSGWISMTVGWCLIGLSLWATVKAIPGTEIQLADLAIVIACAALAVVAGFVSMLPGGVGVREYVLMTLLVPTNIGGLAALASALLLRLTWLVAELAVLALLYIVKIVAIARRPTNADEPQPSE